MPPYKKPPLTFSQQAALLISRGFIADQPELESQLRVVGYYRLCAYWHPFKQPDESFKAGTTFHLIRDRYSFDRKLRLLVMDAIERVEIAIRSALVSELSLKHGPFGHLDPRAFPDRRPGQHERFIDKIREDAQQSREVFVSHFKLTYDEFPDLPFWAASEIMTFGTLLTVSRMAGQRAQKDLAAHFGVTGKVFDSWFLTLNYVRNMCAHHSRLLNRNLAIKPLFPDLRLDPRWHKGTPISNARIFGVLTVLSYLLKRVAPDSTWQQQVKGLVADHPRIDHMSMGSFSGWEGHPLW